MLTFCDELSGEKGFENSRSVALVGGEYQKQNKNIYFIPY